MTENVRPRNSILPGADVPIGYVDGKPVILDPAYYRHFEDQWSRTGLFNDDGFDNTAAISDSQSRLEDAVERVEALAVQLSGMDFASDIEALRERLDALALQLAGTDLSAELEDLRERVLQFETAAEESQFQTIAVGALGAEDIVNTQLIEAGAVTGFATNVVNPGSSATNITGTVSLVGATGFEKVLDSSPILVQVFASLVGTTPAGGSVNMAMRRDSASFFATAVTVPLGERVNFSVPFLLEGVSAGTYDFDLSATLSSGNVGSFIRNIVVTELKR